MRDLDDGKTFIITRNGVPVGELTPFRRHRFVPAEADVAMFKTRRFRACLDAIGSGTDRRFH